MKLKIKICGMRDPENIAEVAKLQPDLMGFIFYPGSSRYAGETLKPSSLARLPETIKRTGVFVNTDPDRIKKTVIQYSLDIVQLHGDENPEACHQLTDTGVDVIKAFRITEDTDFEICEEYIDNTKYFLFDTYTNGYGGSGKKFDWAVLEKYTFSHPFFLSGGIAPGDEEEIGQISNPSFYGLDLNSRFEKKAGIKDIDRLSIFLSNIRGK